MRERPIMFNGAMVRAILAGQKTQTRRPCKPQPSAGAIATRYDDSPMRAWWEPGGRVMRCPFGQPGDRLWVRETWRPQTIHSCAMDTCDCDGMGVTYAADNKWIPYTWQNPVPDDWSMPEAAARGNVPSIHMPRWACRLVLEITAVRVERLRAISAQDCIAEGITTRFTVDDGNDDLRMQFRDLWTTTGGDWDSNPWVWVIEFKRMAPTDG